MVQSATHGLQLLTASSGTLAAAEGQSATNAGAEEGDESLLKRQVSSYISRQLVFTPSADVHFPHKSEGPVPEGQTCLGCSATSTPEWRRGPMGRSLFLIYKSLIS